MNLRFSLTRTVTPTLSIALACLLTGGLLTACGDDSENSGGTGGSGGSMGGLTGEGGADPGEGMGGSDTGDEDEFSPRAESGFGEARMGGGRASGYKTLTLQVGSAPEFQEYKVQTNPWGGATQTINAGGDAVFRIDAITHPEGRKEWEVTTFPSVYIGTANGGHPTADSGLPLSVGDIGKLYTGLKTNSLETSYRGNATFDVYFTHDEGYTGGGPDVYLMVWFDSEGLNPINGPDEVWNCDSQAPTFIGACSDAGSMTVNDKTFHRFIGPNGSSEVISYVPDQTMGEWEFDLNAFIRDAVSEGIITDAMYLQSVQAGFELTDGGVGLEVQDFYVDIVSK